MTSLPARCFSALLAFSALASGLQAAISLGENSPVQIGGFFSQGYMISDHNNYPVDTKNGTADFREIGFNASTTLGSHLRLGGQLFAQRFGKYGDDKVVLDWAVADYNFRPEIGVRVGRIKYPRSLQSDVLDLDVVRPFIFLPQSIYDTRLRDFQASFDGAMVYGSLTAGKNTIDYKFYYGDVPIKTDSGVADYFNTSSLYANPPGLKQIGLDSVRGAALSWTTPVAGLRLGATYSYSTNLLVSGPFRQVPSLTSSINLPKAEYMGVSVDYTTGPWTFTSEYFINKLNSTLTLPAFIAPPSHSTGGYKAWYVSAARRLGKKFELGTYYTETWNSYPSATALPSSNQRKDWALALRYDVNDHLLFKIEGHAIDGTRDMFNVPGVVNNNFKNSMSLFAAKTTLSF
ncbi:MAG: porin [Verrucomicrobia bacterium]|nr:porin [Verrucomicrobiota bacterium]